MLIYLWICVVENEIYVGLWGTATRLHHKLEAKSNAASQYRFVKDNQVREEL
jgi:hypothetical protein